MGSGEFEWKVSRMGLRSSSEWDRWGVVGLRNGFWEISRMGLRSSSEWDRWGVGMFKSVWVSYSG